MLSNDKIDSQDSKQFLSQCVLCASPSSSFSPFCAKGAYSIVRCNHCRLIFVNPRDSHDLIFDQYQEDATSPVQYYENTAAVDKINFRKRLRWVEENLEKGKVLDVGCNVGTFLEVARERGWQTVGIEPNKKAAEICMKKNLRVTCALFDSSFVNTFEEKDFDLICMNDVIEHFPDPLQAIKFVKPLLKKNGCLAMSTPNIRNILAKVFQIKPKEHLFYFDSHTLRQMLAQAGFEVQWIRETGRRRAVGCMHLGSSIDQKWLTFSKVFQVCGLDSILSVFLEFFFHDEIFVLARSR
ncbi:MAG: class I SAM-dependent methyltransferase [Elusimicrobia bacterium]|nr:class I SAM-dependent methyltransferase [Elusimicrobiota bacterium]